MSVLSTLSNLVQNLLGSKPAQSTPVAPSTGGNYQVPLHPRNQLPNPSGPGGPLAARSLAQPLFVNLSAPATASPAPWVWSTRVSPEAQADTFEEQANAPG